MFSQVSSKISWRVWIPLQEDILRSLAPRQWTLHRMFVVVSFCALHAASCTHCVMFEWLHCNQQQKIYLTMHTTCITWFQEPVRSAFAHAMKEPILLQFRDPCLDRQKGQFRLTRCPGILYIAFKWAHFRLFNDFPPF